MDDIMTDLDMDASRLQALEELKTLVEENDKDLYIGEDNNVLLRYLFCCNFNVQRAYDRLTQWYILKKNNPVWYASKPIDNYTRLLDRKIHCMLEKRDNKGRRVYIIKLGNIVVSEQAAYELSNIDDLWLEATLDERETQKNGMVFVLDLKSIPYGILKYLTPSNVQVGARKAELVPLRVMEYHLVNCGFIVKGIVNLVFPFLAEESKKNIHFHNSSDFSSLHKFVNPEALPPEYGGTLDQTDVVKCRNLLLDNEEKLLEKFSFGYQTKEGEAEDTKK